LEHQALKLLPFEFARVNRVAVDNERQQLLIGPDAPLWAITEASRFTGAKLPVENLPETEFDALLSQIYSGRSGTSESVMEDIKDFVDMESAAADLEDVGDLLDAENDDAPIVRLLNAVLTESLKENASDIHIEPYEKEALVRFRLDGVLRTVLTPSIQIAPLLISRIKVMSKLDIAEKRLPQDGRMSVLIGGRSIDLRGFNHAFQSW
jgi:general secretion pathway protein E